MSDIKILHNISTQVRRDILRMVHKVNSGHPGGSLGCVEFFVSLYFSVMKIKIQANFALQITICYSVVYCAVVSFRVVKNSEKQ